MGLILYELTGVDLLILELLDYCQFPSLWTLIFLSFALHFLLFFVSNMHYAQRGTSYFKSRSVYCRNPSFSSLNMDLVWRLETLPFQNYNYCCKRDINSGNMILSIFLVWYFFIRLYNPLMILELIQYMTHSLIWVIYWFEEFLSYYRFVSSQELNDGQSFIMIIGDYIYQIHHLIVTLISLS